MEKKKLVVLTGPTAVGKTKLSIELAKRIGGEIISADSMQVYKYINATQQAYLSLLNYSGIISRKLHCLHKL